MVQEVFGSAQHTVEQLRDSPLLDWIEDVDVTGAKLANEDLAMSSPFIAVWHEAKVPVMSHSNKNTTSLATAYDK